MVDRVAFNLFGIPIYWYALIIVSGVLIAMWLSTREAVRVGLKADDVTDFMLVGLPIAIIGARLYYVMFDLQLYLDDPIQVFNIRNGGIAIYGALIAGGLWLVYFCYKKVIPLWTFLDIAAPSVVLAQAIGRWGNFMNHEAFGGDTTRAFLESLHLPNFIIENMYIDGIYRQPTFLYESTWNVIGFILLIILRKQKGWLKEGEVFLGYVIWYSFGRFFIEGMRTDSLYLFANIRISQLISLVFFVAGWTLLIIRRKDKQVTDYNRSLGENEFIL
ncbi:MAG: prolipoprotein diacylglyceryl transferase [Enterococcus sp.]